MAKEDVDLDAVYARIPGETQREKNIALLYTLAETLGLPTELLPGMPHYYDLDRPLTYEEICDDMHNREMILQTSPIGNNPHYIDHIVRMHKENNLSIDFGY